MMRYCSTALLVSLFLCLTAGFATTQLNAEDQPNILFVFADDQCYETIAAFGHEPEIDTPNLDKLVTEGTTFTHCYNMGSWSGAVCVASRTMLNTGRFVWHAEAVHKTSEQERQAGRWWSEYMKGAGYRTYFTGKWHCNANAEKAFNVASHVRPGMPRDTKESYNRPAPDGSDVWSPTDPKFKGYWEGGTHWSEVVANDAVGYLGDAAKRDEPFFMYVAFNAPHDPRQSPQEYIDRYPLSRVSVPENFLPEYPFKDSIGAGPGLRDEKLGPFPRTEHAVQVHRQEYYALITHMDAQIGRIFDALDSSGKRDNTWIFFTADHGLAVGHHGLFGKQNMYEHSVRVPFMVVGPGVEKGKRLDTPIYLQDVMPTTLALAGVEQPDHVEFQDLQPILAGDKKSKYEAIYGGYLKVQRSVTHDGWKLILYPKANQARLYHVAEDPQEMHDLADTPQAKARMRQLFAVFQKLQAQNGDTLDLAKTFPELQ